MLQGMSTPNVITLSRVPLLLVIVVLLYMPWAWARFLALFLLPILYLMDWLDGYVARFKNQVTDLGSVLDIAIDRVVENVLWLVFAHQQVVPVWIPIVFILRSFVVDGLRGYALARGHSAFGMMHSAWGKFLVASRFMRALYGLAKGMAFGAIALSGALTAAGVPPQSTAGMAWLPWVQMLLIYLSVALCIARGIPVLVDIQELLAAPPDPGPES